MGRIGRKRRGGRCRRVRSLLEVAGRGGESKAMMFIYLIDGCMDEMLNHRVKTLQSRHLYRISLHLVATEIPTFTELF